MVYHTALDVSLRSVSICIVDDDGAIQFEGKTSSDVEEIVTCLKGFNPEVRSVGFEAGPRFFACFRGGPGWRAGMPSWGNSGSSPHPYFNARLS